MATRSNIRFVDLDEARAARGLRLVVLGALPSPWSEAAKGIFDVKEIDYLAVRFHPRDEQVRAWTGSHNAPVVLFDDEPPRTGWAEILALGERLGGRVSLVPHDPDERVLFFGLAQEILGEGGIVWCVRLLVIHAGLTTEGREGFPPRVAGYLGKKYGYAHERIAPAKGRLLSGLRLLSQKLEASRSRGFAYVAGPALSALDIYVAAALAVLVPLPDELCPMLPPLRHAFETIDPAVRAAVTPALIEHRDFIYQHHLALPVQL
jgi:glutathione S-transferase